MPSSRSLLIAVCSVVVCYFLFVPPNSPTWLPLPMRKQTHAATGSLAIGISLTVSYGTVSIRHDDGSFEDIGRVDGDQVYLNMMQWFSLPSSAHPAPPYNNMEDQWDDQRRQWLRSARKLVFLPASSDVRTLSTITSSLISLAKHHSSPSSSVASVVIAYPTLPGLYAEDISDTALYLSLPQLPGSHVYPPRTIVATYAGYGMGLCSSYLDKDKCREEDLSLPVRSSILVDYSSTARLLHATSMREAYDLGDPDTDISTYFFSSKDDGDSDDVARRQEVRDRVMELLRRTYKRFPGPPGPPKVVTVLLTGDTDMIGVSEAAYAAVEDEGFEVEMFVSNAEFVAARGAAELAWRALSLTQPENIET